MKTQLIATLTLGASALASLFGQAPWSGSPLQRGIAAVTCGAPANDGSGTPIPAASAPTFGLVDLRNPASADYGPCGLPAAPLWDASQYHHASWNAQDLGNVFGIALGTNDDIYVAAHGLYGTYRPLHHRYGDIGGGASDLNAAGTVYHIDGSTGATTVFCVIPGQQAMPLSTWGSGSGLVSGPGLGNVSWDYDHDQLFVTSLEDGRIYRVDATGTVLNFHDPFSPDSGAVGMPPRNERLWAVEYEDGAVYYSVWNDGSVGNPAEIRRVDLDGSGDFIPTTDTSILFPPGQNTWGSVSAPVSDISFTLDGQKMILGVRTMVNDTTAYNHNSGTQVAELISGSWTHTHFMRTGCNALDGEAYGGVALGEEGGTQDNVLWSSSADMAANFGPHGNFGVRLSDVPVTGQAAFSWKVPYMPGFTNTTTEDWKGSGGDIEILRERDDCARIEVVEIHCPEDKGAPYTVDLSISHNLPDTEVYYLQFKPCPDGTLPSGSTTVQPEPSGILTLPTPLAAGESYDLSITLPVSPEGGMVYFKVKLLSETGEDCCLETVCVDLPDCQCAEVLAHRIECERDEATGLIKYTLTFQVRNLTHLSPAPITFTGATFLPPAGFDPASVSLSPTSIAPGATGAVTVCYLGTPGPLCFNLALHDGSEENCCAIPNLCVELPPCEGQEPKPDTCRLTRKVPCCPKTGQAILTYTICNNSLTPRTYTWSALSFANPSCPIALAPGDLSPNSGVIGPVPPGGCASVTITVNCERLEGNRPCTNIQVCAETDASPEPICCRGIVYRPSGDTPVIKLADPTAETLRIGPGEVRPMRFVLENPGDSPLSTKLWLFDETLQLVAVDQEGKLRENEPYAIDLEPGGRLELTHYWARNDNGGDLGFAEIEAYFGDGFLATQLPILLQAGDDGKTRPSIKSLQALTGPEPAVKLEIETLPGRFYRIQESRNLQDDWETTECVVEGDGYANGVFTGTGGVLDCTVPCEELDDRVFYRVLRLDSLDR
ncbi:hypothetical protein [Roseibacillus ishigakijimensis]|uniref:Uncharacterized protein n=1 Tax=Roseibacillus ishigakijimensis TaxID=454146 RepID=A0A934RJR5_9BACT|nr:hypothetical protein [Roseibacillus ishigakijimensis]MBK1832957.1 hypothetical protein [Roseibacillus ishigakijimensis]